jgi:PAS domain S-box-containing protein
MAFLYSLVSLLVAMAGVSLGAFIFARNTRHPLNRLYMLMCLSASYACVVEFGNFHAKSSEAADWLRHADVVWPFVLPLILHFVLVYTESRAALRRRTTYLAIYLPAVCISVLQLSSHLITGTPERDLWGWTYDMPSRLWPVGIAVAWALGIGLLSLVLVVRHLASATDVRRRTQAKFILLGLSLPIVVGLVAEGLLPLASIRAPGVTAAALVLSDAVIAYGIWKHRLFELTPSNVVDGIVDTMQDALLLVGNDGKITSVNRAACGLLGYQESELVGLPLHDVLDHQGDGRDSHAIASVEGLARSGSAGDLEVTLRAKNGRLLLVSLVATPLFEGGLFAGAICVARDIAARKEVERALQESEERYRTFVQNFQGIAFRYDMDAKPIFFHGAVENITGYTEHAFVAGKPEWQQIVHPDDSDSLKLGMQEMRSTCPFVTEREYRILREDGQVRWVHEVARNVCGEDGKPAFIEGAIFDTTDRNLVERRLQASTEDLRRLTARLSQAEDDERRRIAADLHDRVGASLAFIKLKLGLLRDSQSLEAATAHADELREMVEQSIKDTRSLTFDICSPTLYEFGVVAALEEFVERFQEAHDIMVHITDDGEPRPLDDTLQVALFRAARECLVNVVKHASAKEVVVNIRSADDMVRISIKDDGVGFNTSELEASAGRRTGLGLFSIQERMESLGGSFEVTSEAGRGTIVVICAPSAHASQLLEGA